MFKRLCLALICLAAPAVGRGQAVSESIPPIKLNKIILVGDSTLAVHSGWGSAFCAEHVIQSFTCVNLGRGGRSTKSYRVEGSWAVALNEARTPGYERVYILIQLGHNDQPGKPGRSTDLKTEYPENLRLYVREARKVGAEVILVTPLTRRQFKDGRLQDDLAPWVETVRAVAAEMKVPLVDLNQYSRALVTAMGPLGSQALAQTTAPDEIIDSALMGNSAETAPPQAALVSVAAPVSIKMAHYKTMFDYTHLGPLGAKLTAAQVAEALIVAVPELKSEIVP